MGKSRLLVISLKEIIFSIIFAVLAILVILLLIYIFKDDPPVASTSTVKSSYVPGIYSSCLSLNNNPVNLTLTIDKDCVSSVNVNSNDDTYQASYPLIPSCVKTIEQQLRSGTSIDDLESHPESAYTQLILTSAIKDLLQKAKS